jgi:cell division protein FtsI/penicillin-binding protein 2
MWAQEGVPPLENIKFVVMLFFVVIMLLTISLCLKIFMDMVVSSRNYKIQSKETLQSTNESLANYCD